MNRLLRLLALTLTLSVCAASYAAETDEQPHFGVRLQYDMNKSTTLSDLVSWGPGVSVGAIYYAPFKKIGYFNAGLLLSYDTFKYKGTAEYNSTPITVDGYLYTSGLKLPIQVGVNFIHKKNLKVSLYTGPQLYFNFGFRAHFDRTLSETEHIDTGYKNSGMEVAWTFGAAADIHCHWHVHFDTNFGLSNIGMIDDLNPHELIHLKRTELSVGVGYNF
ncbi:MAG: PorT family protein [Muribaculaceae bacterium]|nr:PorT family protein [Muribaculaceae bacterium]